MSPVLVAPAPGGRYPEAPGRLSMTTLFGSLDVAQAAARSVALWLDQHDGSSPSLAQIAAWIELQPRVFRHHLERHWPHGWDAFVEAVADTWALEWRWWQHHGSPHYPPNYEAS